ncbi:MAG: HvfA family oxazolone/thioamide-modified RiPP metallophore [Anaerolineae bacterium]
MNATQKTLTLALGTALTAAIGVAGVAHAAGNPFAMQSLSSGYMVAAADKAKDGKCGEGKCGGNKAKAKDGKCGEGKCGGNKDKAKDGNCGGNKDKAKDGNCGGKK